MAGKPRDYSWGFWIFQDILLVITVVIAIFLYRARKSPHILYRNFALIMLTSAGLMIFLFFDTTSAIRGHRDTILSSLLDFCGDIGIATFLSSLIVRSYRLEVINSINKCKTVEQRQLKLRSVAELKRKVRAGHLFKIFLLFALPAIVLNIPGIWDEYEPVHIFDMVQSSVVAALYLIILIVSALRMRAIDDFFDQSWGLLLMGILGCGATVLDLTSTFFTKEPVQVSTLFSVLSAFVISVNQVWPLVQTIVSRIKRKKGSPAATAGGHVSKRSETGSGSLSSGGDDSAEMGGGDRGSISMKQPLMDPFSSVMVSEETAEFLREFLVREFSVENFYFWKDYQLFASSSLERRQELGMEMFNKYYNDDSPLQLNLPSETVARVRQHVESGLPFDVEVYTLTFRQVESYLRMDSFPRFLTSKEHQRMRERMETRYFQMGLLSNIPSENDLSRSVSIPDQE